MLFLFHFAIAEYSKSNYDTLYVDSPYPIYVGDINTEPYDFDLYPTTTTTTSFPLRIEVKPSNISIENITMPDIGIEGVDYSDIFNISCEGCLEIKAKLAPKKTR